MQATVMMKRRNGLRTENQERGIVQEVMMNRRHRNRENTAKQLATRGHLLEKDQRHLRDQDRGKGGERKLTEELRRQGMLNEK